MRWGLVLVDCGFGDLRLGLGYEGIPFSRTYIFDFVVCAGVKWP